MAVLFKIVTESGNYKSHNSTVLVYLCNSKNEQKNFTTVLNTVPIANETSRLAWSFQVTVYMNRRNKVSLITKPLVRAFAENREFTRC